MLACTLQSAYESAHEKERCQCDRVGVRVQESSVHRVVRMRVACMRVVCMTHQPESMRLNC
jgi:hypothetical protein